ncbi:hypothetical protein [Roseovarius sp.]|uniref:hypothetical protein n=1 Tax=Roseovarius sp. TaxID=1486281 RepID=UPI003BAAEC5A
MYDAFGPASLDFIPYDGACGDFLITTSDSDALRSRLSALGAEAMVRNGHTVYTWNLPRGQHILSGTGIFDGRFAIGPAVLDRFPEKPGVGMFNLLSFWPDKTSVRTDICAHHSLYYGNGIVTNRLHLAAIAVGRLDQRGAFANAAFNSVICHQLSTIATPVEGVSVLLGGEEVEVTDTVTVHRRDEVFPGPPTDDKGTPQTLTPEEYHALVEKGAEEIIANVQAILDSGRPVTCDISGGRDSRIVLAAVVALRRMKDVVFNTKVTPNKLGDIDVAIATGLVKEFGGSYHPTPETIGWDVGTPQDRLLKRRSHFFGTYHFFPKSQLNSVHAIGGVKGVRMLGGAGEIYRDVFQKFLQVTDRRQPFDHPTLRRHLMAREAWEDVPDIITAAMPLYTATFDHLPGATLSQKVDSHYFFFRNSYHYGIKMPKIGNAEDINPGVSVSLLKAARGLPPEVKATGRVVFDITRALCEKLAYVQYDKPWEVDFTQSDYHRPSQYDGKVLEFPAAPELLQQRAEAANFSVKRPQNPQIDFKAICWQMFTENFDRLRAQESELSLYASDKLYELGKTAWENMDGDKAGINRTGSFASRMQAFNDFLTVMKD